MSSHVIIPTVIWLLWFILFYCFLDELFEKPLDYIRLSRKQQYSVDAIKAIAAAALATVLFLLIRHIVQ